MTPPQLPFRHRPSPEPLALTGHDLSVDDVVDVARHGRRVRVADDAVRRMRRCRSVVEFLIEREEKVYGLTTGFGKLRDKVIPPDQTQKLQVNLIRSHACGVGRPLPEDATRAAMLLRANTLCKGNSGIRPEVVALVTELLDLGLYPLIPEKGSVGASGDLAPLSHMVLVVMGDPDGQLCARRVEGGWVKEPRREDFLTIRQIRAGEGPGWLRERWAQYLAKKAALGVEDEVLEAKEGLALNNGTQIMTAIASLAVHDAYFTLRCGELAAAISLEANRGVVRAYDPRIHLSRGQTHQAEVARRVIAWCEGSEILSLLLNSARIRQAGRKLREAREHLEELRAELDERGANHAVIGELDCAIEGLLIRLEALIPTPGAVDGGAQARREFLMACAQKDAKEQIQELDLYLNRCRQEITAILTTAQQHNFPRGERSPQLGATLAEVQGELARAIPATPPVQDDYSFRCFPQVMACAYRALDHVHGIVHAELNAATDNPLIFPPAPPELGEDPSAEAYAAWLWDVDARPERIRAARAGVIGGGNFHGEPVAIAMDYFSVAMAEVGNISERRVAHLVDPALSQGLPAFLIDSSGLNSGFMIPQYSAASLVSENKVLCHPASVDSIPTCANSEDHVSMGTIAARKAAEVLWNVRQVIAIELLTARQGLSFRAPLSPGRPIAAALEAIGDDLPIYRDDGILYAAMERARELLAEPDLLARIESAVPYEP